jgi:hypothetical protein
LALQFGHWEAARVTAFLLSSLLLLLLLPQVFDSVSELIQSALDGYHVCLFSYGQTGAGKTYTMSGGSSAEQQGIMPRSVNQVNNLLNTQTWQTEAGGLCCYWSKYCGDDASAH